MSISYLLTRHVNQITRALPQQAAALICARPYSASPPSPTPPTPNSSSQIHHHHAALLHLQYQCSTTAQHPALRCPAAVASHRCRCRPRAPRGAAASAAAFPPSSLRPPASAAAVIVLAPRVIVAALLAAPLGCGLLGAQDARQGCEGHAAHHVVRSADDRLSGRGVRCGWRARQLRVRVRSASVKHEGA